MPNIDYSEFEKFMDEFANQFPVHELDSAEIAFAEMGDFLLGEVPEYPAETLDRLMPPDGVTWLRTEQQKKWFFASVRSGSLPGWKWTDGHPEKIGGARSGNLGRAQGRDIVRTDTTVELILGFDPAIAPYAPWVVGDDFPGSVISGSQMYQARVHVDRWWQFGSIMEEKEEQGWQIFLDSFWKEFSERINR